MRRILTAALLVASLATAAEAEPFAEAFPDITQRIKPELQARTASMQLLHGKVSLTGNVAEVVVPEGYYLLGPDDARYVVETLWGNPPDPELLGLLFPATMTPFGQNDWGATFEYDPMGYVSDSDAEGYDYTALLKSMQDDTVSENPDRKKQGFAEVTLLGWAEPPHYDKANRSLVWAKRIAFSDAPGAETLNYNIRALGRKGVLLINFIAGMGQLAEVQAATPAVMQATHFTEGNRYSDFLPGADTVAAVGIGGLIAGKVLSSTGILAVALVFLKKGAIILLLAGAWIVKKLKSVFSRDRSGGPGPTV